MSSKVIGTPSALNIVEAIANVATTVGNPSDWSVLLVGLVERICNSFEGSSVPLYQFLFTRLGMHFPFSDIEMLVMNHLRFAPHNFI